MIVSNRLQNRNGRFIGTPVMMLLSGNIYTARTRSNFKRQQTPPDTFLVCVQPSKRRFIRFEEASVHVIERVDTWQVPD